MSRVDPILALLLTPFVAASLIVLILAVAFVARHDKAARARRRNLYAPSPATVAARAAHQARAGMGE